MVKKAGLTIVAVKLPEHLEQILRLDAKTLQTSLSDVIRIRLWHSIGPTIQGVPLLTPLGPETLRREGMKRHKCTVPVETLEVVPEDGVIQRRGRPPRKAKAGSS